jgi:glutathione S-transferase
MGLFSIFRKKDVNQEIELTGITGHIATLKCLILAGIKDVPLRTTLASYDVGVDQVNSYQYIDSSKIAPTIKQGGFTVSGTRAVLTYIDIRGKGPSLTPRKARILGQQNYWVDVCFEVLGPVTQAITTGTATNDDEKLLNKILTSLNNLLSENLYIVGPMTFADPHVAAYIHALGCSGIDMMSYPKVAEWVKRLESDMGGPLEIEYFHMDPSSHTSANQVA